MLDKEIYGLIAALGIALAIFFFFFYWLNLIRSNSKLKKRCGDDADDEMQKYIRSQRIKALLVFILEVALVGILYLIKEKFL